MLRCWEPLVWVSGSQPFFETKYATNWFNFIENSTITNIVLKDYRRQMLACGSNKRRLVTPPLRTTGLRPKKLWLRTSLCHVSETYKNPRNKLNLTGNGNGITPSRPIPLSGSDNKRGKCLLKLSIILESGFRFSKLDQDRYFNYT